MKFIMNYSIGQKKHLLWCVFDDDGSDLSRFKVCEFRVCDCFLDWTIPFQNENMDTVFSEEVITDFFDATPTDMADDCDIFSIFGKITIVCCRNALYHFFYKEDVQHDKLSDECLGYDIDMRCMYLLEKKMFFSSLCSNCQFNFIKNVSTRLIKLKNDQNSS